MRVTESSYCLHTGAKVLDYGLLFVPLCVGHTCKDAYCHCNFLKKMELFLEQKILHMIEPVSQGGSITLTALCYLRYLIMHLLQVM